jgi:Glycosyl hydrolase family 26
MNGSLSGHVGPDGTRSRRAARRSGLARTAAWLLTLAAIAALVAVARPGGQKVAVLPAAGRTTLPPGRLVPAHGAYFGAYVKPLSGVSYAAAERAVRTLEHKIGRKLAIDQLYVPWARKMPLAVAHWDLVNGRIPMISWAGYHTRLINNGRFDAQIRRKARHLAALHGPVMLRWFPEMDGRQYRGLVPSAASFIRAWRRVHRIFVNAGARNITWVWCPNAGHIADRIAQLFYPGARYVDWICADGYNWAPRKPGAPWKTFADIFSSFYRWGIRTGKPLMIGEFGVLERRRGEKGAWMRQTDRELRTMFPAIRAVIYFNAKHKGYNWRVTTSWSALSGFRAFAHDPHFSAKPKI